MSLEKFININWFISQKPYSTSTQYDLFYLEVCRRLYKTISTTAKEYPEEVILSEEDCRRIAYIITGYFEDVVNDFGFWQSFIKINIDHYGKRLPFFEKDLIKEDEALSDDVHYVDIYYLLFINYTYYLNKYGRSTVVNFRKKFFEEATVKIIDVLNELEEVPLTNFYDTYLLADIEYIAFKQKLKWFTFKSYLTGIHFTAELNTFVANIDNVEPEFLPLVIYAEEDRLMFEQPSHLTGFFPIDIFAGALNCTEENKTKIRKLKVRPHGIFHVQNELSDHYLFLHTATREEFKVLKSSFDKSLDTTRSEYFITTLACWRGVYNVSGICLPSPYEGEEIYRRNIKDQHTYQRHHQEYIDTLTLKATEYYNSMLAYFKTPLVLFKTGAEMQQGIQDFTVWYNNRMSTVNSPVSYSKKPTVELPKHLIKAQQPALFISVRNGFSFNTSHNTLLYVLQVADVNKVSMEQMRLAVAAIFDPNVDADYWRHLRNNYYLPNMNLFAKCNVDEDCDFEAWLRLYKPAEFSPLQLPSVTTFTSERMSFENAMELFKGDKNE